MSTAPTTTTKAPTTTTAAPTTTTTLPPGQCPTATVVIDGLVTSTLLTLLVTIAVIVLGVMYLGSRPKPQPEEKESIFYEKIYGEE